MSKFVPTILREFELDWAGEDEWTIHSTWFAKQTGVLVNMTERKKT